MTEKIITRVSLEDLKKMEDRTRIDAPEGDALGTDFWAKAQIVTPEPKKSVHLRLDDYVLEYFKAQGKGHVTKMQAVLRSYVDAQKPR